MARPIFLSKNQAADYVGVPVVDFDRLVAKGILPAPERGLSVERWCASYIRAHLLANGNSWGNRLEG
jgi:hypothetical protein